MDHVDLKDRSTYNREQVGASAQGLARREFAGDCRGSGVRPKSNYADTIQLVYKMNKAALTAVFGTKRTYRDKRSLVCFWSKADIP